MGDPDDDDPRNSLRIGALRGVTRSGASAATDPADAVAGAAAADAAAPVDPAPDVGALGGPDAVAHALATGAIDPAQARAALIDDAVAAHLQVDADPLFVSRIRAEVEALLADDPVLAELLRR